MRAPSGGVSAIPNQQQAAACRSETTPRIVFAAAYRRLRIEPASTGRRISMSELPVGSKADETEIEALSAAKTHSRRQRLRNELRTHPVGYSTLAVFLVLGPVLAPLLFPPAPPAAAAVGGLAFGVYAALCAAPQKFL
jgi:hypothetical protein